MSIPIPDGHRMLCPTCDGSGTIAVARAATMGRAPGRIGTGYQAQACRDCEGTGWIPPRHPPAPEERTSDETD